MGAYIIQQLIAALCGAAIAGLGALCGYLAARLRHGHDDGDAMRSGMMAILHDRIFQAAHHYCERQHWCSLDDKRNIEYLYKPYAALGGNGTGKTAYEAIMALPTEPPENN
jgi:hypothetical protein